MMTLYNDYGTDLIYFYFDESCYLVRWRRPVASLEETTSNHRYTAERDI